MSKSYADLMNDISADELYERLLAYGLFADKLPPILSSVDFYNYCNNSDYLQKARKYGHFTGYKN